MRLIDTLVACSERSAEAHTTFAQDDYGVHEGLVSEPALVECMAQTMAAHQGQIARERGIEPKLGMLVGVKDVTFERAAECGHRLNIQVNITHQIGSFYLSECSITQGSQAIAEGTLKFYLPGETA